MPSTPLISWIVRPPNEHETSSINELLRAAFTASSPTEYSEELLKLLAHVRDELLTCGTWYVVLHPDSEQVVGCGGWTRRNPGPSTVGSSTPPHLRHFATHPNWERRGVGRAIWHRIQKDISEDNVLCKGTELEVFSTFKGEPFYASLGFVPVKRVVVPLTETCEFPCILMRRRAVP